MTTHNKLTHQCLHFSASVVQSKAGIAVAAFVCDAESRNEVRYKLSISVAGYLFVSMHKLWRKNIRNVLHFVNK